MTTNMTTKMLQAVWMAAVCGALMMAGCKISQQNKGEDAKVSIEGPGGSVKVDTGATANDSGIALYPGAKEKQNTGDNKSRAHVNLDMPFLKVKVVAMEFTSDDAPQKILEFYRKKLQSYGTVVECKGDGNRMELRGKRGLDSPVICNEENGKPEEISLRVGTEGNQHQVSVKPSGKGSEFALVYVHVGTAKGGNDYGGKEPS